MERFKVRQDETDKARAQLAPLKGRALPPGQDARKEFQQQLENALGLSVQARLPDTELKEFRVIVIACHAVLLEEARQACTVAVLQCAMKTAKSVLPLLGPLGPELDKEHDIAVEYLAEINAAEQRKNERQDKNLPDIPDPMEFMCPITQATMMDPVVAADGNSYEREAIEKHVEHSSLSPLTNTPWKHRELTANNALKQLIRSYEEKVQGSLVQLHHDASLARTTSRAKHMEEKEALEEKLRRQKQKKQVLEEQLARQKQALEEQLRGLQQADAAEEHIENVTQGAVMTAMLRRTANPPALLETSGCAARRPKAEILLQQTMLLGTQVEILRANKKKSLRVHRHASQI